MRKRLLPAMILATVWVLSVPFQTFGQTGRPGKEKKQQTERKNDRKGEGGMGNRLSTAPVQCGNIVLGCPTDRTITASIILEKDAEGYIEYQADGSKRMERTEVFRTTDDQPLELLISALKPDSRYSYRLYYRRRQEKEFIASPTSWFATKRSPSTRFSFGVQGDSHPEREGKMFHPELYRQTLRFAGDRKPDFYFLMGDDFNIDRLVAERTASKEKVEPVYLIQRHYLGNAGANPPLFLVNGNHEQAARYLLDGTPDNPAVQAGLARKKYFPLPSNGTFYSADTQIVEHVGLLKDYYAFEWGNALFVVIDPYWHSAVAVDNQPGGHEAEKKKKDPWGATLGTRQYEWLKKTLEQSKARFKFVFAHHVNGTGRGGVERARWFEWGGYGPDGTWQFDRQRAGWPMPIHELFVKNKVTIFFQGHDHLYARQELDGVTYQTVPNPADPTYTAFNSESYRSGTILPNSGYLHVTVSTDAVTVDYIRSFRNGMEGVPENAKKQETYTVGK